MKICDKVLQNNLFLAPLAGYSDAGFRAVCSTYGADVTFSEMLSAAAMQHSSAKTAEMTFLAKQENITFAQIFGHDPDVMAEACKNSLLEKFDGIDINLGCPALKIVKNGEGSALLKNLPLAAKIIESCVKANSPRPTSVKVRLGFNEQNVVQTVRMCEEAGASFVSVHGRTTSQGYGGSVDLEAIASAKAAVKIPVVGNGDVTDALSHSKMLLTGVDGVMIGRGAVGKPWVFSELSGKNNLTKFEAIKMHVELLKERYCEKWLRLYLRKHFLAYASSLRAQSSVKQTLALLESTDQGLEIMKDLCIHFEKR